MTAFKVDAQLNGLLEVSPQNPLPINDKNTSASVSSKTGETVALYYLNSGVVTADAGQAAGTVVFGKLTYSNIQNNAGFIASYGDTSLSFTSTALTTEVAASTIGLDLLRAFKLSVLIPAIGEKLSNGQFVVLYQQGLIVGKKADTSTSLTSTAYKYGASVGGGVSAVDNATFTTSTSTTTPMAALVDEVSTGSVTEGNSGVVRMTATRELRNAETYAPVAEDNTVGVLKVEQRFSPSYISTATTTTIKSGAGFLHTITITEAVASTIIVYDNTAGSGTILASFVASAAVGTYHFNVSFGTGLTIVTAGASKLTTSYR